MKHTQKQPKLHSVGYFGYWVDWFMLKLAQACLPMFLKISWLTPNMISIISFLILLLGCVLLFVSFPFHLQIAGLCLPLSYFFDCLDGKVARERKIASPFGSYLDKVIDIFKLFFLTISMSWFAFAQTHNVVFIFLGMTALFSMMARFYIKYCTMFSCIDSDEKYLAKSAAEMAKKSEYFDLHFAKLSQTFSGTLQKIKERMSIIFFFDEGEYVFIAAVGLVLNQVPATLGVLAVTQLSWATFRALQRGYQINIASKALYQPMRK